jgi:hypothetical protein
MAGFEELTSRPQIGVELIVGDGSLLTMGESPWMLERLHFDEGMLTNT